ncbi:MULTISPECIES: acyl-CoA dehydrogenase family protein [Aneurinibacillus]|jgi:acyl-CoA dehydrogenase|uniref:Acyl-CoA dehydrogenase n=1 Tax=Aneurinibacillus danicus TaxID=267746 RepID=A0A511V914_9BACL|nr:MULTISPECIES: acyl-CoA dehydrogenase family protein [Aneurinibacillus]GEN35444.1 acyl-CoA dehydrogenase [Aneurinibacillus danicus]
MTDIQDMILNTATKIMEDLCTKDVIHAAEQGAWAGDLWNTLAEVGMTTIGIPEESGGAGGSLEDAMAVLRIAGRFSAPIPLAETLMANRLLSLSGLPVSTDPLTVVPVVQNEMIFAKKSSKGWVITGKAGQVPWAEKAKGIVVVANTDEQPIIAFVDSNSCTIKPGINLANEPRNEVVFQDVFVENQLVATVPFSTQTIYNLGALTRVVLMTGSLERILELSVHYSKERSQFGKPIGRFQAIQQQLAVLAGEVSAASIVTDFAVYAFESEYAKEEIMIAKIRVGNAVSTAVPIAHQVHGAIGFTDEYPLHHSTRRLWSWRDEFGTESEWANDLGEMIIENGPEKLWPFICSSKSYSYERTV